METVNEKTDKMPINRVILMSCGRYNPPTHMHLRMFERARDHLHILRTHTVVGGIISPVGDHCQKDDLANSTVRCDLLNLALQTNDWIRLSTWEVQQNTHKSMKETLRHHQNVLNYFVSNNLDNNVNNEDTEWIPDNIRKNCNQSPIQIKLLCGSDLLESFSTPGKWSEDDISEIVGLYGLVVIGKEGGNPNKFIYDSDILSKYIHNIHVVTEWIPNEVNATRIRRALRRGESVKYLLNNNVIESIYRNEIYCARRLLLSDTTSRLTRMGEKTSSTTTTTTTAAGGRVVLMSCGSYNPPTHMHLRMFERARDHLHNLGSHVVVGGVISPVNDGYGKKELASGEHRVEMLRLALRDSDWIRLSTWEIRQSGWTRTRQSLQHHQNLLNAVLQEPDDANRNIDPQDLEWVPESVRNNENDAGPVQIKLLCGGDLLESFATPGLWAEEDITEIVSRYGLIVITREGSHPYKFIYDSDILSKNLHNIQIVTEWIPNEVSSTRIRRALKRGESVKYLLQDAVIDYVYTNGIYGANRSSTIKLDLSSNNSSTDYLDADETKYPHHHHDNAFLTPSPSDITMLEASPCRDPNDPIAPTAATTTAITPLFDELPDSVLQRNFQNSSCSPGYSDERSSPSLEETELAREKFFRSIAEPSSSLLQLVAFNHSDSPVEITATPGSARARNELLAFEENTTESELATLCDNTSFSEDREDGLSVTYEESSEDLNESSVRNNNCRDEDTTSSTTREVVDINESFSYDNLENTDSQATKFEANYEIDGKYIKSLVNSKKNGKKTDDDDDELSAKSSKNDKEEKIEDNIEDSTVIIEEIEKPKVNEGSKKEIKFDDDISYIKRLRLVVVSKPAGNKNQRQQLQGSLDSINLRDQGETIDDTRAMVIESMTKKSKSFESIKRLKSAELTSSCCNSPIKPKSDNNSSTSQMTTAPLDLDTQTDEFCTACCFASSVNELQQQPPQQQLSSTSVYYTIRSNCSSPVDEDSTECDICSSCNLRDSNDGIVCKSAAARSLQTQQTLSEMTEICEICGEPATSTPEPMTDEPKSCLIFSSRLPPLSLPKAKSTIEISKGSYRRTSALDDERFEIDNCGLQDCKLRASLDVCNKTEPLYVNLLPRYQIPMRHTSRHEQPYLESEYCNRVVMAPESKFLNPKDEVAMSRSFSGGGSKRLSRKGSYAKKSTGERVQEKRRYSSVDNLQNRQSFRTTGVDKFSKSRDNKFMTSADSIRPVKVTRSRSLRRSADNVGRFDSSGDNLDSLEEAVDTDENGAVAEVNQSARVKVRDSDTIKMILTKHGIKIISQKETVL